MVRPAPAAHRVADALREEILAGGLRPGAQLVEESLAGTLGVSRNTVREAYALLAGERIVERIPARGVFVARPVGAGP
jgi:DNA-binding GntR family transcriptional regulator